jgi:hypothetical protein
MALYITRAMLSVNGTDITDFKAVTEKSRKLRKAVPLMYKTGAAELTQRFTVDVEYVVPRTTPEFDFDSVTAGTLVIDYDSGEQVRFGGVHTEDVGDAKADGENELTRVIAFVCETRNGSTGA